MKQVYQKGMTFKITSKRSDHALSWVAAAANSGETLFCYGHSKCSESSRQMLNCVGAKKQPISPMRPFEVPGGFWEASCSKVNWLTGCCSQARCDIGRTPVRLTSPGALKKAQDLTRELIAKFGGSIPSVPFTEIQENQAKAQAWWHWLIALWCSYGRIQETLKSLSTNLGPGGQSNQWECTGYQ